MSCQGRQAGAAVHTHRTAVWLAALMGPQVQFEVIAPATENRRQTLQDMLIIIQDMLIIIQDLLICEC